MVLNQYNAVVSSPPVDGEVLASNTSPLERLVLQTSLQLEPSDATDQDALEGVRKWPRPRRTLTVSQARPLGPELGSSGTYGSNRTGQDRLRLRSPRGGHAAREIPSGVHGRERPVRLVSDPRMVVDTDRSDTTSPAPALAIEAYRFARSEPPSAHADSTSLLSQVVILQELPSLQGIPPHPQVSHDNNTSLLEAKPAASANMTTVQLTEMTATQMLQCLVDHGCADLTSSINPEKTSQGMVIGGSFGDIWSGQLRNNTAIAIKVWRFTSLVEDKGKSLKRAMREICHWSELDHPHIHKLLGVTVFQGRLGMVSEWMPNGNLREYIQKNSATNRQSLCAQVTSSVQYLHRKDTVHGDIKADGVVKLSDFDHSIMIDCSIKFTETSRVGGGTLRWMAPELVILEPSHQRNKRTDVYALGMTLLEIMTGRVPYELECQNDFHIYTKLSNKVLPKWTEHFADNEWGNGMWDLLVRCWDHDPNARPDIEVMRVAIHYLSSQIPMEHTHND